MLQKLGEAPAVWASLVRVRLILPTFRHYTNQFRHLKDENKWEIPKVNYTHDNELIWL